MWEIRVVVLSGMLLPLTACVTPPSAGQYELDGQIVAIGPEQREVLIKHGDIKGFMPGMTMPFKVRDSSLLQDKVVGDLVKAKLNVSGTEARLETLVKTGSAPVDAAVAMPPASFVAPLGPGEPVPDTTLIDQRGAPLRLSSWRGSAVAVAFIYIRCPLPQFCPLLDRRFADVQQAISSDKTLEGRTRLLSVSFDPEADTGEQLTAHAQRLKADPALWRFATAPHEVIDRFAAQFGVNVIRESDGTITHNMRTAVIGPDGRIVSVYSGSDGTPAQVVEDMRRSLAP